MKYVRTGLSVLGAAVIMVGAAAQTAHAAVGTPSVDDRLAQIAEVDDAVALDRSPVRSVTAEGAVTLGSPWSGSIELDLPVGRATRIDRRDGRYVLESGDAASLTVTPTDTGAQVLIGIESDDAPSSFEFGLDAPAGFAVEATGAGTVDVVDREGTLAAQVAAPWAFDAKGRRVPTRFEVRGDRITQIVDHRSGDYAYPIVADPKVFLCDLGISICVKFTKSETKSVAKKAEQAGTTSRMLALFICAKIPNAFIGITCAATVLVALPKLRKSFINAAKKGKCVELHFRSTTGLLWKWKTEKC